MIQYYGQKPITANGQHLVSARKVIPKGAIVGMLSTVRSRILRLATDLEALDPQAGDAVAGMQPVEPQALNRVVTNVFGGAVNVIAPAGDLTASGEASVGMAAGEVAAGSRSVASSVRRESAERNWFARHPWISGISVGVVSAALVAIYLAVWGVHLP